MKKFILVAFLVPFLMLASRVYADTDCGSIGIQADGIKTYSFDPSRQSLTVTVTGSYDPSKDYLMTINYDAVKGVKQNGNIVFTFTHDWIRKESNSDVQFDATPISLNQSSCVFGSKLVIEGGVNSCNVVLSQNGKKNLACYDNKSPIYVSSTNLFYKGTPLTGQVNIKSPGAVFFWGSPSVSKGMLPPFSIGTLSLGQTTVLIQETSSGTFGGNLCQKSFNVKMQCDPKDQEENSGGTDGSTSAIPFQICDAVSDDLKTKCTTCLGNGGDGVWTGLGCIHTNPTVFIAEFLKIALGIAGGIALLLMAYGGFTITTSVGDPKKAEEGREMITGTIAGLLFIVFSVVLLKIIGVDILQIPGIK